MWSPPVPSEPREHPCYQLRTIPEPFSFSKPAVSACQVRDDAGEMPGKSLPLRGPGTLHGVIDAV